MTDLPVLDHDLAPDELAWMESVYSDFAAARADFATQKDALRSVLGRAEYRLSAEPDMSGRGPWLLGQNAHGRRVAAVFLPKVELHTHVVTRTDQFVMYVAGEADAFSIGGDGQPVLTPVTGGAHFHNPPGVPHAFLPKAGQPVPEDWEIAFIAITPRNLREDTHAVSDGVRAAYRQVVGGDAPVGV